MSKASEIRPIDAREREIIGWILTKAQVSGADKLLEQLPSVAVKEGGTPTFLDLEVPAADPRADIEDGPLPVRALVDGETGELEGEILLWVSDGHLSGLEFAWYTDEPPTEWPATDRLVDG
jgi:hypothetical protein